jgi:hypothetical protein
MNLEMHLRIAGALLIALGLAHAFLNRYFNWSAETTRLTLLTRQIFYVHCFFIGVVLVLMGTLSTLYAGELLNRAPLSHAICGAFAAFWILRLLAQWFVYDSRIWRGSPFRTVMHWMFSLLWVYLAGTYSSAWWT